MIIPTLRITDPEHYDNMVKSYLSQGIDTIRVNMARHSLERYYEDVSYIQNVSNNAFHIMVDIPLPGRKYRLALRSEKEIFIQKGELTRFSVRNSKESEKITVDIDSFNSVKIGDRIILGDGESIFSVVEASEKNLLAAAENNAVLRGQRSFIVPGALFYQLYTQQELDEFITVLRHIHPQKIVLSFAEDIDVLLNLKTVFENELGSVTVVPKIETQTGVDNCETICENFKEIMLGRGDLALFSDSLYFGETQERVINTAQRCNTNVIVATDILTSLYQSRIPARGELTDIYYLKSKKIRDVVSSAGISMQGELFDLFCQYAKSFR